MTTCQKHALTHPAPRAEYATLTTSILSYRGVGVTNEVKQQPVVYHIPVARVVLLPIRRVLCQSLVDRGTYELMTARMVRHEVPDGAALRQKPLLGRSPGQKPLVGRNPVEESTSAALPS